MLESCLPIILYEATINPTKSNKLLEDLGYRLFDARTLQAVDVQAYTAIALHQQKHLGGLDKF